jgi:cytoskeleton protein RodZ
MNSRDDFDKQAGQVPGAAASATGETGTPADNSAQIELPFSDAAVASSTMNTEHPDSEGPKPFEAQSDLGAADNLSASTPALLDAPAPPESEAPVEAANPDPASLGSRLRLAREARGMRCEVVAQRLKLPAATIHALEADCYERIGQGIYLRGYLTKYLRLLDLPQVLADRVLNEPVHEPPLTTTGTISRPRYLFDRYSGFALYLILTGVIIVPAVLLAMRAGFEPNLAQITPLDTAEPALPASIPADASATGGETDSRNAPSPSSAPVAQSTTADETPLVASLAPFPASTSNAPAVIKADPAIPAGQHALRLSLTEPSWVEITALDGEKLEFGLLAAGTTRSYVSAKSVDVRVGNATGATVEIDGKAQDLTAFRHSNVAHFKMSDGELAVSHTGN